ncbi:response regulator transcription factor [Gordonia sp. DT219]|uniref:response regulator transcription factor n=1 Tax=Gordonia sp. DT219 TaxID=3416658 RepID=UPI003CEB4BEF
MAGPRLARASISRIDDYRSTLPRNGFHPIAPVAPVAPVRPAIGPAGPSAAALAEPVRRPVLSPRETEVLLAWLAADSKEEAAEHLFIAASTVSTHLARIRAKYAAIGRSAPTKTHLLARALQDGITRLEDW